MKGISLEMIQIWILVIIDTENSQILIRIINIYVMQETEKYLGSVVKICTWTYEYVFHL